MNNYAAALQAIVADPDLQASLRAAAGSTDEITSVMTNAGLTIPTQQDVDEYNSDPDLEVQGAVALTVEVYWIPE